MNFIARHPQPVRHPRDEHPDVRSNQTLHTACQSHSQRPGKYKNTIKILFFKNRFVGQTV
jgi:hypothetical protein